ncbi:Uncharacterised protein [Vibrio cholerae]|uniref:Uncharacterized protein n=2 Tax=Vibrio cholerae TaxID=666 RepID=A0A085T4M5_VIBCL|nr:hypothetical protein VC0395_A0202 [Vibrio cholerae O395]AEA77877.1 hypothetical protein VCLMA_A0592 [Vibrio cholerae LMA3984-4]AYC06079.1 Adenosine (5')-pentaphospho-(5'')-adenosine pyrophosphohydrolase [Vibrio cholerae]EEY40414.1 hypothetical protein VIJ_003232 [Vibrio cholerae RC27]EGR02055.1 hypothetical protein VCHE39_1008 [Vibrio cholerae HE39]EGR09341.1 hypothetical protein VCHE48_1720 [Vibrio cholerae HE48]EGS71592.1 hypothetical protein VCBJG01_0655 [Vibrio cholerae BJG-01]EJH5635
MRGMSHKIVDNLDLAQNLSFFIPFTNKYRANHNSKFAPLGDMWKNQRN